MATRLPDENLVAWADQGLLGDLDGARVLDIGCGNGRNARWFADKGARVLGIDISDELVRLGSNALPATVTLERVDVLRDSLPAGRFDLVYDSGCFHHVAPHRWATYLRRVLALIAPDGRFGVAAFASEAEELVDDAHVLASGDNAGGSSFELAELTQIFAPLALVDSRRMQPGSGTTFGADFLNVGLFRAVSPSLLDPFLDSQKTGHYGRSG